MKTAIRDRKLEILVTASTVALVVLSIITYILDQHRANWVCGAFLFILEILTIGFQTVITISVWTTSSFKKKIALLLASVLLLGSITVGFINFTVNCS